MELLLKYLLVKYERVDVNVKKKARYFYYFIGILTIHSLFVLMLSIFVETTNTGLMYTGLSIALYVLLGILVFRRNLSVSLYLFLVFVFARSLYLLSVSDFEILFTFLAIVVVFIATVYNSKIDFFISIGVIAALLLTSLVTIINSHVNGHMGNIETFGIIESVLNMIVMSFLMYIFVFILEKEVDKSRALQEKSTAGFLMKAQQRREFDKIKDINKLDVKTSVLIVGIDRYNEINEEYGVETGDLLLKEVITIIRNKVRVDDYIIRWNNDNFLVVLNFTPLSNAGIVAEKIRSVIYKTDFSYIKKQVSVTVAAVSNQDTMHETISKAENLLSSLKPLKENHVELDYS